MNEKDIIIQLRSILEQHNHRYYVVGQPTISDREYDELMKRLIELENNHPELYDPLSPSQRVGSDLTDGFAKVAHKFPMLSISNSYSYEELGDFQKRIWNIIGKQTIEYVAELKFDGLSISLIYLNGRLNKAVTRGNKEIGDDVTINVKTIKSIPLILKDVPKYFEVRGEIILPRNEFIRINAERTENGDEPYANPRNTAAGTLKSHSPAEVSARKLDAYFYQLLVEDDSLLPEHISKNHSERLIYLKELGFKVHQKYFISSDIKEIQTFLDELNVVRKDFPFDTDGAVIKVNSIPLREQIGYTSKNPKWATAFKFETEQAETKLLDVIFQVGRTGTITPVAILEPVELCQTIVRRATLHNADQLAILDLRIGDSVYVEKGGEIIPKIIGVNMEKRIPYSLIVKMPDVCPECGQPIQKDGDNVAYKCFNENCTASAIGKLVHFASKECMNIDGLGPARVQQLFDNGLVSSFSDFYKLKLSDLIPLERMGVSSASKLINAIEQSKEVPFAKVLYSLGIPKAGETRVNKLAKKFKNIDTLLDVEVLDIISMDDFGEVIADSVVTYLAEIKDEILKLKEAGLCFEYKEAKKSTNSLVGKSFCITGTLSKTRPEFQKIIEANGGEFHKDVKKNTQFVLVGSEPGNGTLNAALKYSVPKITEQDFNELLQTSNESTDDDIDYSVEHYSF